MHTEISKEMIHAELDELCSLKESHTSIQGGYDLASGDRLLRYCFNDKHITFRIPLVDLRMSVGELVHKHLLAVVDEVMQSLLSTT